MTTTLAIVTARAALANLISLQGYSGSDAMLQAHDELLAAQRACPAEEVADAVRLLASPIASILAVDAALVALNKGSKPYSPATVAQLAGLHVDEVSSLITKSEWGDQPLGFYELTDRAAAMT